MADLLIREHKKNSSGSYDNVYRATKAKIVELEDGGNVEDKIETAEAHAASKSNPHKVTAAQTGAVPTSRTVNGKALSSNISLTAANVGALPTTGGTMSGAIAMGNQKITGLGTPSANTDAATKGYVDDSIAEAATKEHTHTASDITSGTIPVARGGTGLTSSPSLLVNLASTSAASVMTASPRPGVTGTLPVARGGTGATTAAAARTALGTAEGYYKSATVSTAGWYRIATSAAGISNNIGVFSVMTKMNGKHSNVVLAAGISFGDNPDIVQILASNYSTASLTKARLVYHETYGANYAYLEIYLNVSTSTTVNVNMALCEGWTLVAPNTAGSIPSGYKSKECIIGNGGIGGYTASRALVTNSSGVVSESAVTSTELGYLDGVTSSIQTQLNGKAASSHGTHVTYSTTAPAAAGTAAAGSASTVARSDHVHPAQTTVSGNAGSATKLATARTIKTNLGSTSAASFNGTANVTPGVSGTLPVANGGTGATTADDARENLGAAAEDHTHSANDITGLTASRALVTNSNGAVSASAVTATELGYLDGVTSAIQTQLNGKAAASHGTHVSFSTTAPKAAGTAAVGAATTVARSDHVHPAQTTVSGNAGTATKLAAARTIRTNLGSTSTASFDGSANVTPGVTGTLPVANGGTGLTASPSLLVNLGSTSAANVMASSPRPGVTGTLPIARGGTGATTAAAARAALGVTPANIGALPLSGGTMTGDITMEGKAIICKLMDGAEAGTMIGGGIDPSSNPVLALAATNSGRSVRILNVASPIDINDATPKSYVDNMIREIIASEIGAINDILDTINGEVV